MTLFFELGCPGKHNLRWKTVRKIILRRYLLFLFSSVLADVSIVDGYVYVGGEDMIEEDTFRWINGESMQGIPWGNSQPNNANRLKGEHCLAMGKSESFTFFDRPRSSNYSFLCQKTLKSPRLTKLSGIFFYIKSFSLHKKLIVRYLNRLTPFLCSAFSVNVVLLSFEIYGYTGLCV